MSARLLRKVLKEQEKQELNSIHNGEEAEEEEDEEPKSESSAPFKNPFDLLDEDGSDANQEDEQEEIVRDATKKVIRQEHPIARRTSDVAQVTNRKSKKKKKKSKEESTSAKVKADKSIDSILADLSISTKPSSYGSRFETTNASQACNKNHGSASILLVDPKHLKAENELRKIFGSRVVNSFENNHSAGSSRQMHGGRRVAHNPRKTILVSPSNYWPRWDGSMSMELLETKDGLHYFRYVHSSSYKHAQQAFEAGKAINDLNAIASVLAHYPYHVESLLTFAELFKYSGEHQSSADAIAKCLFALECAWSPLFTPLQGNCQLKYTHDTNKPLFTALFSHMKNMDRRGCHRSALEVCKLLLSLDSDDPKGALFCIDYFSLRAQEYRWLEQFSEDYVSDTSLWSFPNFSYSLAVSRFYLEREAAAEPEKSTAVELMKQALMLHPLVLQKLVDKAPLKDAAWTQILRNSFFGSAKAGGPTLEHLINIYVERNYLIWRFPELQNLLKQAAVLVIESIKQGSSEAKDLARASQEAFSSEKNEYSHLLVSDFSDTIPTIPPEEMRQFMVGPEQMVHEMHAGGDVNVVPERAPAPREVAGRNIAAVLLESLLPWVNYGDNRDGRPGDHDEEH